MQLITIKINLKYYSTPQKYPQFYIKNKIPFNFNNCSNKIKIILKLCYKIFLLPRNIMKTVKTIYKNGKFILKTTKIILNKSNNLII